MRKCLTSLRPLALRRPCVRGSTASHLHRLNAPRYAHVATDNAPDSEHDLGSIHNQPSLKTSSSEIDHDDLSARLLNRILSRLPSRFQSSTVSSSPEDSNSPSNAQALERLLSEGASATPKIDILYDLAVERGQWKAAVWIARRLLETSLSDASPGNQITQLVEQNSSLPSLKSLTENPINWNPDADSDQALAPIDIDAIIGPRRQVTSSRRASADHRVLGHIWRSLGLMTLACVRNTNIANGFVKPEILEILALFHHHGFMPSSVYTYLPSDQLDAIQQPATLHLLSQRIMVALSDAAWRGRESAALESTGMKNGDVNSTRLEMLGSSVRANIEVVKPEMWLELILWSCIHGGWEEPGIDIMIAVCRETNPAWSAMSWRKNLRDLLGIRHMESVDWAELMTAFGFSRKSSYDPEIVQVERTLSSELVNAYVEVVTGTNSAGRGLPAGRVFRHLETFRNFLKRTGLNLHSGTWDSTILRMIENNGALIERTDMMAEFVRLSPTMGEELSSRDDQAKPLYVLDGNAALLGLLHRALQAQVDAGSLAGALRIFKLIRRRVDDAKQQSVEDFFRSHLLDGNDPEHDKAELKVQRNALFTSNFHGVEHPNFEHQIPVTTMSCLLDLITQLGAHRLGKALINEGDIDGYLLDKTQFGHPQLAPALIRFATATEDNALVARVVQARNEYIAGIDSRSLHLDAVMSSILSELFMTRQWHAARRVFIHMSSDSRLSADAGTLAVLSSSVLKLESEQDSSMDLQQAWQLVEDITVGDFSPKLPMQRALLNQQRDIIGVLSVVSVKFASLAEDLVRKAYMTSPDVYSFNHILDAVAATQGSKAAKALLNAFRPSQESNQEQRNSRQSTAYSPGRSLEPSFQVTDVNGRSLTVRHALKHNFTSFVIVLRRCLQEYKHQHEHTAVRYEQGLDVETTDLVQWAVQGMLVSASSNVQDVREEVQRLLEELDMTSLKLDVTSMLVS